jgi:hypothetical protein
VAFRLALEETMMMLRCHEGIYMYIACSFTAHVSNISTSLYMCTSTSSSLQPSQVSANS